MQSLIDGKLFITAVTENPEGGGYTLSLVTSDGEASQIVIKDGEAGAAPAIGVKLDSDGKYYWTLDGEQAKGQAHCVAENLHNAVKVIVNPATDPSAAE